MPAVWRSERGWRARSRLAARMIVLSVSLCSSLTAQDESLMEVPRTKKERAGDCRIQCEQYEACIETRCVEMCRPSCREGAYCSPEGTCEAIPEPKVPILTEADRQRLAGSDSADSATLVFVDLAGAIGFGVQPGIEWGRAHSVILRAQIGVTGLMSHAVFFDNEFMRYEWSFGGSLGYRRYESEWGNLRGFYYGGGLGYSITHVSDRVYVTDAENLHAVAPYGEFGYRWVFKDVAIGFGPSLALRYPIGTAFGSTVPSCANQTDCKDARAQRFEGTIQFEVGWFQ